MQSVSTPSREHNNNNNNNNNNCNLDKMMQNRHVIVKTLDATVNIDSRNVSHPGDVGL